MQKILILSHGSPGSLSSCFSSFLHNKNALSSITLWLCLFLLIFDISSFNYKTNIFFYKCIEGIKIYGHRQLSPIIPN